MSFDRTPLARRIDARLARYVQWEKPLRRHRALSMQRIHQGTLSWQSLDRELADLEAQLCTQWDPRATLYPLLDDLCTAYLDAAAPSQQAEMRAHVASRRTLAELLWRYANFQAATLALAEGDIKLRLAMAAVVLENCAFDYRDTLMTLADLFAQVEATGLDPHRAYADAATIAADEPTTGGCPSLACTLRDFHSSSVLRERRGKGSPYRGPL
ncbi:MAG TPA: hypothetical protein PJ982_00445 [Lacipirellulaceae bacterium]|nr:hypothetical protein [Lacipirellulaceae bacterium]